MIMRLKQSVDARDCERPNISRHFIAHPSRGLRFCLELIGPVLMEVAPEGLSQGIGFSRR